MPLDTRSESPWVAHWRWADRPGLEALVVSREGDTLVAASHVLVVLDGTPLEVAYRLTYDREWRFLRGFVRASTRGADAGATDLELARDAAGEWLANGEPLADLAGCADLDVTVTPFTNTPPLRRLGLAPGEARELRVAWLRFPELTVSPVRQEYLRLGEDDPPSRFLYRNLDSGFEGELTVDEHRLVVSYGPWRRVAGGQGSETGPRS